jgi:iron complex outermembrane receptor protein
VIDVITKRGADFKGAEVSADAGSLNTYRDRATYGMKSRSGTDWLLSGTYFHSLGNKRLFYPEFDSPVTNSGFAIDADSGRFGSLFGSTQYRGLRLEAAYVSRDKFVPTAPFGAVFNDPRTNTLDARGYVDLSYDREFGDHWELLARMAYDWYRYHGVYVMDYTGDGVPLYSLNEDYSQGQWWTAQAEVSRTFLEKHHITIGTEQRFNTQQDQWNYDLPSHDTHLNDRRSSTVAAVYAQDQYKILRNLILSAGLRYDHYQTFGGSLNPRFALIYRPWERTAVKVIYGQAFRAPNAFELYYTDQISEEGNPHLRPESVKTTELICEQYFLKRAHLSACLVSTTPAMDSSTWSPIPPTICCNFRIPKTSSARELNSRWAENGPAGGKFDWLTRSSNPTIPKTARTNLPPPDNCRRST